MVDKYPNRLITFFSFEIRPVFRMLLSGLLYFLSLVHVLLIFHCFFCDYASLLSALMISTFPAIILQILSKAAFNLILPSVEPGTKAVKCIQLIYIVTILILCVFFLIISVSFVLISFSEIVTDGIFSLIILAPFNWLIFYSVKKFYF